MFVVGDYVPKWLPKWASQHKTIMSDLRLRNGNFPFQNRKGCELGLYRCTASDNLGNYGRRPGTHKLTFSFVVILCTVCHCWQGSELLYISLHLE